MACEITHKTHDTTVEYQVQVTHVTGGDTYNYTITTHGKP